MQELTSIYNSVIKDFLKEFSKRKTLGIHEPEQSSVHGRALLVVHDRPPGFSGLSPFLRDLITSPFYYEFLRIQDWLSTLM